MYFELFDAQNNDEISKKWKPYKKEIRPSVALRSILGRPLPDVKNYFVVLGVASSSSSGSIFPEVKPVIV